MDLRKIIAGNDPALAQQLVDSSFFWITDLTEPDPWYGLPIFTGALLYLNVEMAIGKKALTGEVTSKSNLSILLKDAFQSLAILMPCFMAQQPSGAQIYLATSMIFTLLQGQAFRNDAIRQAIGLPAKNAKPSGSGELLREYMEKMAERQAAKAKGGFILGEGVHMTGANISIPKMGKKRKSSIVVEKKEDISESQMIKIELPDHTLRSAYLVNPDIFKVTPVPFLPGMARDVFHTPRSAASSKATEDLVMPDISAMEAANRGEKLEKPVEIQMAPAEVLRKTKRKSSGPINAKKFRTKMDRKRGR